MTLMEERILDALDAWRCEGETQDWHDVLCRAGASPRPRSNPRRRAAVALAALGALAVATTPAFGIARALKSLAGLTASKKSGLGLEATLGAPSVRGTGSLQLEASGVGVAVNAGRHRADPFVHVAAARSASHSVVRWRLTFTGIPAPADRASLVLTAAGARHTVLTLCSPCASGASGRLQITRAELIVLFRGGARAELEAGNELKLAGSIHLVRS